MYFYELVVHVQNFSQIHQDRFLNYFCQDNVISWDVSYLYPCHRLLQSPLAKNFSLKVILITLSCSLHSIYTGFTCYVLTLGFSLCFIFIMFTATCKFLVVPIIIFQGQRLTQVKDRNEFPKFPRDFYYLFNGAPTKSEHSASIRSYSFFQI